MNEQDVIAILHGEESADELFNWLIQMPFVEERADGWAYHIRDKLRNFRNSQVLYVELHEKPDTKYGISLNHLANKYKYS